MTICLYHGNCLDGAAAAWVVENQVKGNVTCVPSYYGNEPNYEQLKDKVVYIVDFSFPNDILEKIESISKVMILIDHHKTAEEQIKSFVPKKETTEIIFDMNMSGATLTWDYFKPDEEPPLHIQYVEDRDLWRFNFEATKAYTAYLYSCGANVETYSVAVMTNYESAIEMGGLLIKDASKRAAGVVKKAVLIDVTFKGENYKIPLANCPPDLASEVGHELCKYYGAPFSITYNDIPNRRIFSLRGDGTFDVSEFAKFKGGGGHHDAAGYYKDLEPVEI